MRVTGFATSEELRLPLDRKTKTVIMHSTEHTRRRRPKFESGDRTPQKREYRTADVANKGDETR